MLPPETSIEKLPHMSAYFSARLKNLGVKTVLDLLFHLPVRYEDFKDIYPIVELVAGQEATVQGIVKKINFRRTWKNRLTITEAVIDDETGKIAAVWFNQPYIQNQIKIGKLVSLSGKIRESGGKLQFSSPNFEIINDPFLPTKHTARIIPVYPETKGLTSKGIRHFVSIALLQVSPITEFLPNSILKKHSFPTLKTALQNIHFPEHLEDAEEAKKRFNFEDLFLLQLFNLREQQELKKQNSPAIQTDIGEVKNIIGSLQFELTESQKKSLWEIIQDVEKSNPMNRLLQGDVGSGKTIVAAIAAILAAKNGLQVAFMAPTEILSRQHYETFKKTFSNLENGVALLTSGESKIYYGLGLETEIKKEKLKKEIKDNKIKIIIGTHALIQKDVEIPSLALVIVDEQHRFGIRQRAALIKPPSSPVPWPQSGSTGSLPHFLSMSATPIPRTLSLTLWSNLDLSLISELPRNRKPIITKVVESQNRSKAYQFIREQIKKGRQAFVICPRIEKKDSELLAEKSGSSEWKPKHSGRYPDITLETKSVKEEYEKLSKKIFPDLKIGMLHGKLKPKEKEAVMTKFKNNETKILVATSVVEVGVDVPNATIMMIEGAERFGLAQLYQFRGRVGRGEHQSFCFLFTDSSGNSVKERLQSIVEAKNGLELAEKDLAIRGPGEFLGEIQTGMPDLAMKALQNPNLVKASREDAKILLATDPDLEKFPQLKNRLLSFNQKIHWE